MKQPRFEELGFAKPEPHRIHRQGFPEAIFCPGKKPDHILRIFGSLLKGPGPVLATRIEPEVAEQLVIRHPSSRYHPVARIVVAKPRPHKSGRVLVITAGTADLPVAEEAAVTATALGAKVERIFDVGVSGLHRLMAHQKQLSGAKAIIVCAGMEGALPSVVGGLASCPVIAVPTSIGYGANLGGVAALLTMLNSCASNVSVVNIDNGFSAGVTASLVAR